MKTLFTLIAMAAVCQAGVIYEVNNYPFHQGGHTITGFWEIDLEPIDPNSFSLPVTAADIVAWGFQMMNRTGYFDSDSTNASLFVPDGLTATDSQLSFEQTGVGNDYLYARALDSAGLFESIVWITNDVQNTFGYYSLHGETIPGGGPLSNARWTTVVRDSTATVGVNPIVTTEPHNIASLLLGCLALWGVWRRC